MALNYSHQEIHYEVQARQGSTWTILDLFHVEKDATQACERAWRAGGYKAVRVLREKFDNRKNTFDSIELTYHGRKFKPSRYDGDTPSVICRTPADVYGPESRKLIAKLLVEKLGNWQITPTELLHCPKHYIRLDSAGQTLQGAIQRTAVAQVKDLGETVQQRIKVLYDLIDRLVIRVKRDWESGAVPDIEERGLEAAITALQEKGEEREFLLAAALARDFMNRGCILDKTSYLITLMDQEYPDWVMRIIDTYLSEFMATTDVALDFAGHRESLGETLVATACLARGGAGGKQEEPESGDKTNAPQNADAPPEALAVLQDYLKAGLLPATRRALLGAVAKALSTSNRLKEGSLDGEMAALSSLVAALGDSTGELLGDTTLIDVLEDRCGRFLNPQFVAEFLEDTEGPDQSLRKLLDLEVHCLGRQNKRRIANYILPVLSAGENERFFTNGGGNKLDRMRYLAKLQKAVKASGMRDTHKAPMCDRLDEFCTALLKSSDLFRRLDQTSKGPLTAAKNLLAMIASECFTEGAAGTAARTRARMYLAEPELMAMLRAPADHQNPEGIALRHLAETAGMEAMLPVLAPED